MATLGLLAGKLYDPAAAVTKSTTALLAMTAIDTTNLRLTFTAPQNGRVEVRIACVFHGSATFPMILLGILEGAAVRARVAPLGAVKNTAAATSMVEYEAVFVVDGLAAGQSYTWDAAYGVEIVSGAGGLKYGGPNDTTADNAFGGFSFEIWDATACIASRLYDPAVAETVGTAALKAMAAFDIYFLRLSFKVPASGKVGVRMVSTFSGATTFPTVLMGVLEGTTVRGRVSPNAGIPGGSLATTFVTCEAWFPVSGLTAGALLDWDAAYGVETFVASTNFKRGGPNDAVTNNAWGAFQYEIWDIG